MPPHQQRCTTIEFIAAPGFSTGNHVHNKIEEIFFVVDGEFNLRSVLIISPAGVHEEYFRELAEMLA